jgi:hypothetical protein
MIKSLCHGSNSVQTVTSFHFMVKSLCHGSNSVQTVTSFKILNDMTVCTLLDL